MVNMLRVLLGTVLRVFRSRRALFLENLALRQQLVALRRRRPRPRRTVILPDFGAQVLVWMETGSHGGHSGNRGPVAPGWIPLVLEPNFESSKACR